MSPETIARLRNLIADRTPAAWVKITVAQLNTLLDAAAMVGTIDRSDTLGQLRASAAEVLPEAIRQRDAAVTALQHERDWITALADMLAAKRVEIETGQTARQVEEIFGALSA